jgi:hypothetical protein
MLIARRISGFVQEIPGYFRESAVKPGEQNAKFEIVGPKVLITDGCAVRKPTNHRISSPYGLPLLRPLAFLLGLL